MRSSFLFSVLLVLLAAASLVSSQGPPINNNPIPANNNVQPSAAALSTLNSFNNFVIIYLTANSYDFLFGAFPNGNGISATNGNIPQLTSVPSGSPYACLPADNNGYLNASFGAACVPNAPFVVNSIIGTNTTWLGDPTHTFYTSQYDINGGAMNGFVAWGGKMGGMAMAHYDLTGSYIFSLASNYTLFDNFFASAFGGVMLNHLYLVSGQAPLWNNTNATCPATIPGGPTSNFPTFSSVTGQLTSTTDKGLFTPWNVGCYIVNNIHPPALGSGPNIPAPGLTQTHIGDLLSAKGVTWAYYAESFNATLANSTLTSPYVSTHEVPFMYFADNQVNSPNFYQHNRDAINFFTDLSSGQLPAVSWIKPNQIDGFGVTDNTPVIGQAQLQNYISAIQASSYWASNTTAIIVTFSDSDGLFDHVAPYAGDIFGPGPRVPTIVISPAHANGGVNHQPYETISLLKMIETRFGITDTLLDAARTQSTRDFSNSFCEPGAACNSAVVGGATGSSSSSSGGGGGSKPTNGAASSSTVSVAVMAAMLLSFALSALLL